MAGYGSRQSTYSSGDTITAAHTNDEFDTILAGFNSSTGHNHDGTAGEGARVLITDTTGGTQYGIPLLNGSGQQVTSSAALTAGQLVIGQSAAVPAATTLSGDATLAASGAITLAATASTKTLTGDTGTATAASNSIAIVGGEGIDTSAASATVTITAEDASATNKGIAELATDAETVTGTDTARVTTPANITAKMAAPGTIGGTTAAAATFTTVTANTSVATDVIAEKTAATGVTIDGVLLKDNIISGLTSQPGFWAYRATSAQQIATGGTADIVFNTEEYDTGSIYDNTTGIFTANKAGKWLVFGTLDIYGIGNDAGTSLNGDVTKNGTVTKVAQIYRVNSRASTGSFPMDEMAQSWCFIIDLALNDTLRVRLTQNTGATISINFTSYPISYFGARFLG